MSASGLLPYTVHWDVVTSATARERTGDARHLLAIWPAPVNADVCFERAGFTDFGDQDAGWERNTQMAVGRLLTQLGTYGAPKLQSVPLRRKWNLFLRLFISEQELPLSEQVQIPMHQDSVPECVVAFGDAGVSLRTGAGHALWWVELPRGADAAAFVRGVAGGLPVVQTSLAWEHLLRCLADDKPKQH